MPRLIAEHVLALACVRHRDIDRHDTTFARRFAHLVGETPVAYLTRWRLCLAAKMLKDRGATVEQAAYPAGFESAATFSRAFKRQYGIPPAQFRSQHEYRSGV